MATLLAAAVVWPLTVWLLPPVMKCEAWVRTPVMLWVMLRFWVEPLWPVALTLLEMAEAVKLAVPGVQLYTAPPSAWVRAWLVCRMATSAEPSTTAIDCELATAWVALLMPPIWALGPSNWLVAVTVVGPAFWLNVPVSAPPP